MDESTGDCTGRGYTRGRDGTGVGRRERASRDITRRGRDITRRGRDITCRGRDITCRGREIPSDIGFGGRQQRRNGEIINRHR